MGTFTARKTRPSLFLTLQTCSYCTTRPVTACSCLPSQLHPAGPAMPANPALQACRSGPQCPQTLPAWPSQAFQSCPQCPLTRPAMPADQPSRTDQQGQILCFGRDAVDPAGLVSSSFLLIRPSCSFPFAAV